MDVKMQMELLELKAKVEVLKRFVDAENRGGKYDSIAIPTINMIMGWGPDSKDEEIEKLHTALHKLAENGVYGVSVKEEDA